MSRFIDNALNLLDAAEGSIEAGQTPSDLTIVITGEGSIRMMADSDWPLESLRNHYGAQAVYRVSERDAKVRIEGRDSSFRTCVFETQAPQKAARTLLGSSNPAYLLLN